MIDRLLAMIRLARVTVVDDTQSVQRLQVDEGSVGPLGGRRILDRVLKLAHFGFASSPPIGSEVLLAAMGGERHQSFAVASNHQPSRLKNLKPGDSAIYDVRGAFVWLSEAGLLIDAAGLPVTVRNTPKLRVEAELLEVIGDVVSRADGTRVSLNDLRDAYVAHKHSGVQVGGGTTGPTDHEA